jgi:hypothetical protein
MCHIQFATSGHSQARPEEIWRVAVEMPTELGLVDRFARHLKRIAANCGGDAVLQGTIS